MKTRTILYIALLFTLNVFCYADRTVTAAVVPLLMPALRLTHTQAGALATVFWAMYTLSAPFLGWLSDSGKLCTRTGGKGRESLLMVGILVWGVSSFGGAILGAYTPLLLGRMGLGLGQAAFVTFAPVIISELFPQSRRGPVITFFYVAIALGGAAGYWVGGFLGTRFGWQYPLMAIGIGVLILRLLLRLVVGFEAGAGRTVVSAGGRDGNTAPSLTQPDGSEPHNLLEIGRRLICNRLYVLVTLGKVAAAFGMNGFAFWMPAFYHTVRGLPVDEANVYLGGCTVCAGVIGTIIGGWLAERAQARHGHPADCRGYFLVSGVGMIFVLPFAVAAVLAEDIAVYLPALFVAEVALFLHMGPSNTVLLNVLAPSVRATGFALNILVMHMLGSVPVTLIMGEVWDRTGKGVIAALVPIFALVGAAVFFLIPPMARREDPPVRPDVKESGRDKLPLLWN